MNYPVHNAIHAILCLMFCKADFIGLNFSRIIISKVSILLATSIEVALYFVLSTCFIIFDRVDIIIE